MQGILTDRRSAAAVAAVQPTAPAVGTNQSYHFPNPGRGDSTWRKGSPFPTAGRGLSYTAATAARVSAMLVTGIKSRPIYTTLQPDLSGRQHVLVGQGSGGKAMVRVLQGLSSPHAEVVVIYTGEPFPAELARFCLREFRLHPTETEAVADLDRTLAGCFMGARVYVAGSESFIGSCVQVTTRYALNQDEVQCEHLGSSARRVYCIHCKASNENVTTNIVRCAGCGRHLLVRDHYSRRLAGFMGVMVDAETPGEIPPIKETFS